MILTGNEIVRGVKSNEITISPFDEKQTNPNSYNYRLGKELLYLDPSVIVDSRNPPNLEHVTMKDSGFLLNPGVLYLGNTLEKIGSSKYVTSLIGRSSLGRLGLFLQISADLGHQNEIHSWTLELTCCKPIIIYPNMIIGQVSFWSVEGSNFVSEGYYKTFDLPQSSKGL